MKSTKQILIGWKMFNERDKEFRQVRNPKGGGTRYFNLDKLTTMEEVQNKAEGLFFPNGESKHFKVKLKDLDRTIGDSAGVILNQNITVGEVLEEQQLLKLRLYLCTKRKNMEPSPVVDEEAPEIAAVSDDVSDVTQGAKQQLITIDMTLLEEADFSETEFDTEDPQDLMNQQLLFILSRSK